MKLTSVLTLLLFTLTAGFSQAEQNIEIVDETSIEESELSVLDQVQEIFSTLVDDLLDNYDYLETAAFNIDQEVTDLETGNLKLSIDAKTIPLVWETSEELEVVELSAGFQTSVVDDLETGNKIVTVTGGVSLNTNVMAFFKRISNSFGECEIIPEEEIINNDDRLANLFCTALKGIDSSSTVAELKPHLDLIVEKAKEIAENQEEANDTLIEILNALMVNEIEGGLEISTIIDIDAFDIKTDELKLTAKEDSLVLSFSGSANLNEEDFSRFLNSLNNILAEIADYENIEDSIYYDIDSYAFIIFDVLENILVPEIIEE